MAGTQKSWKCCICGKMIKGYGNNPWPIVKDENAKCCDKCNDTKVIEARLSNYFNKEG